MRPNRKVIPISERQVKPKRNRWVWVVVFAYVALIVMVALVVTFIKGGV